MGKPKWVGIHLANLIWLDLDELERLYPDYTRDTLKGKRDFWKKKILKGEAQMPERPPEQQQPHEGKLKSTWEVAAFNR